MQNTPLTLLGIVFDNANINEAANKVLAYINMYQHDHINRYVCTVNVDFLAKALNVNWSSVNNPELLEIYRSSHLVTCDGMPLVWLSWLLGSKLKERVTGVELVCQLASVLAQNQKSIFLLGSTEQITKVAGIYLEALNPGLQIVGHASPWIYTEGKNLLNIKEDDDSLIEEINRCSPDVLLIAFGNPKQELWFHRVKHQLKVPVSIGVGGSFDLLSGAVKRSPNWMQNSGLEWLFRLLQEPKRLWRRYFIDAFKFAGMAVPLVIYHNFNRCMTSLRHKKKIFAENPLLFLSTKQTIAVIPLPSVLDENYSHFLFQHLEEIFNQDAVVFDFENVLHITLEGLAMCLKIWQKAERKGKEIYSINIRRNIRLLLKLHRIWDIIDKTALKNPQQVLRLLVRNTNHSEYYESIQQTNDQLIIYFFGKLSNEQNKKSYIEKLTPLMRNKDCILDFRYCTNIENGGFTFLLQLLNAAEMSGGRVFLHKRSNMIKNLFTQAKVEHFF